MRIFFIKRGGFLYKITMKLNIVQQMYPLNHTYINDIIKIKSI